MENNNDYQIEIDNFIMQCAELIAERYKALLRSDGKYASGKLINSVSADVKINGKYLEIWFNVEDYWQYVENGRKAGSKMPPIDAIESWIKIKNIAPHADNGKAPSTKQLAFVIARSIAEKGIPATKALLKSLESSQKIIDDICDHLNELILEFMNTQIDDAMEND